MDRKLNMEMFPKGFFTPLKTHKVNYNISHLFVKNKHTYDFEVKLSNGVPIQREYVWNNVLQNGLILSILQNCNIPPIDVLIYDDGENYTFRVIDGKQRLMTIQMFINNELPIIVNGEKFFYSQFSDELKNKFCRFYLDFNVMYEYNNERLTDKEILFWFNRINFSKVEQDEVHKQKLNNLIKL